MAAQTYYPPFIPAFSSNGAPVPGALLNFYVSGTTMRSPVYADEAMTIELPNPVPADAAGKYPAIYLDEGVTYRVIQTDAAGAQLGDAMDPYVPGQALKGPPGNPGPAGNVAATLDQLKEAPTSNRTMIAAYDGSGSPMTWTTGNFAALAADRPQDYVQANGISLTTGAWVRQGADAVRYNAAFIPAPPRPVNRVLDDIPTLPSLGVTEDNTPSANSAKLAEIMAKARDLAVGTADPPRIRIPRGFYQYDVSPNFAVQGMTLDCEPGAQLVHTGSGRAFVCDGGATGGGVGMMKVIGGLVVRGNANTTDGVYQRAIHHSTFDMEIQNVSVAGLRTEWAVCNEYWIRVSPVLRPSFSPVPTVGAFLSARNTGERTSRCTFYNPIFEGINGYGINLDSAIINTFLGGTSESNVGGIFVGADAVGNIIDGLDLEFNTTIDVFCQGVYNVFRNLLSDNSSQFGGLMNMVDGGLYDEIINTGQANAYRHINFSIATGAFTENGTLTNRELMRNATAGTILPDMLNRPVGQQQFGDIGTGAIVGRADMVDPGGATTDVAITKQGAGRLYLGTPTGRKLSVRDSGTSFYGVPEIGRRSLPVAATDAATTQALVNAMRQYLIDHGQCS